LETDTKTYKSAKVYIILSLLLIIDDKPTTIELNGLVNSTHPWPDRSLGNIKIPDEGFNRPMMRIDVIGATLS
jgi:hypothetical protein